MVISFVTQVFEADWKQTTPYKVRNTYSASDMAVITNKTLRPVDPPEGPSDRPYITPKPTPISINAPVTVCFISQFIYSFIYISFIPC